MERDPVRKADVLGPLAAHRLRGGSPRQHADKIEVFYEGKLTAEMPRIPGEEKTYRIDYRHVIWSLVRKPARLEAIAIARSCSPRWRFVAPTRPHHDPS